MTTHLPYEDWLSAAQKLSEGRSTRTQHICGDGDVLVLEHTSEGYRGYCHRCHLSGWRSKGRQSLNAQLNRLRRADDELKEKKFITLPSDYTREIPPAGLLWLSRGGITSALAAKYNIGYSPYYARVFLPVYRGGDLVYWQARAVHQGQTPKYINPKVDKSEVRFVSQRSGLEETIVVTEDILSAIRVGEVKGVTGCSILGTTASPSDLRFINSFKQIILWFDPDEAGRKCTLQIKRSLALIGRQVQTISSDKDPKEYTHRQLQEMLSEQLRRNNSPDPT